MKHFYACMFLCLTLWGLAAYADLVITGNGSITIYPGQVPASGMTISCASQTTDVSAHRSSGPVMKFQCKDQRGIAGSASEKELETAINEADRDFRIKCRAAGAGIACATPNIDFNWVEDAQGSVVGTCTVTFSL